MFLDTAVDQTISKWMALVIPTERVFVLYMLTALVLSAATFVIFSRRPAEARPDGVDKGLLGYIFDKRVWFHSSARQDYVYFFLNGLLYYGIVSQLMIGAHVFYGGALAMMEAYLPLPDTPLLQATPLTAVLYTLAVVLAIDLAVYITHYLQHKVAVLWEFHMVHHSAEVLTPATVYRMHPVDLFFTGLVASLLIGTALAGFVALTGSMPSEMMILNVNIITFTFYLMGYNLRHSHIWLSYPVWMSYIFISPAQHQTHHSIDEKHYDRNFGLIFAFWDWVFGTLYVPRGYEKLEFGISKEDPNPFKSVGALYVQPFQRAWALLVPAERSVVRGAAVVSTLALLIVGYAIFHSSARPVSATSAAVPTVHMENLTWTEVARAMARGYDTVIVPTGGVEQNGPHMILGKHNYVVRKAAHDIAHGLGKTLVAPVIAYVPEGETGDAPTEHMRWPGTLSVPPEVFEAVLTATAESLKTHGFRHIYFVGDSLFNQEPQANVAARLTEAWGAGGPEVRHIGAYYEAQQRQFAYLETQGFTTAQIGSHAGIRDTSELLAATGRGVRSHAIAPPQGWPTGAAGDISLASAEIGQTLLRMKVAAALAQITQDAPGM